MNVIKKKQRDTKEVFVEVILAKEGEEFVIDIQIEKEKDFFCHLLESMIKHSGFYLNLKAKSKDNNLHHLIEEIGICIGEVLKELAADRRGLQRFGFFILPMDDSLVLVCVDISSRGGYNQLRLEFGQFTPFSFNDKVEGLDTDLIEHFLDILSKKAQITISVCVLYHRDTHHTFEAIFKALGLSLKQAFKVVRKDYPTTSL